MLFRWPRKFFGFSFTFSLLASWNRTGSYLLSFYSSWFNMLHILPFFSLLKTWIFQYHPPPFFFEVIWATAWKERSILIWVATDEWLRNDDDGPKWGNYTRQVIILYFGYNSHMSWLNSRNEILDASANEQLMHTWMIILHFPLP